MPNTASMNIQPAITDVFAALYETGVGMIDKLSGLNGLGFKLLIILFSIMFFYNVLIFMLEGHAGKIMIDVTKLAISFVIVGSMLIGWSAKTEGGGLKAFSVAGFFLADIPALTEKFNSGPDPTTAVVSKHVSAVMNLYRMISPSDENAKSMTEKFKDAIPVYGQMRKMFGWSEEGNAADNASWLSILVSTVLLILAAIFIMFSLVTFVFVINAGTVMLFIGLALGPVLIPFLLIQKLSFLFDGWLRFMISASLYKVIAFLVATLALSTIDAVVNYTQNQTNAQDSLILMSLIVLFFAMLTSKLMGLSDNMASTIASGGANSGGDGGANSLILGAAKTRIK
jgi:hypothetical protein